MNLLLILKKSKVNPRKDEIIDQFDEFFNEDFTEEILLKEYQSIIGDESTFEAKE